MSTYTDAYESGLAALADPTRRSLMDRLRERPRSVGELAGLLPVSQPAVSQHLRVLQEADLVNVRREGSRRIYSLERRGLEEVRRYIETFWDEALDGFARAAERRAADEPGTPAHSPGRGS